MNKWQKYYPNRKIYLLDDLSKQESNSDSIFLINNIIQQLIMDCMEPNTELIDIDTLIEFLGDKIFNSGNYFDEIVTLGTDGHMLAIKLNNYLKSKYDYVLFSKPPIHINIKRITYSEADGDECGTFYSTGIEGVSLIDEIQSKQDLLRNKKILMIDDVFFSGGTIINILNLLSVDLELNLGILIKMNHFFVGNEHIFKGRFNEIFCSLSIEGKPPEEVNLLNTKDLIDSKAILVQRKQPNGSIKSLSFPFYRAGNQFLENFFCKNSSKAFELCKQLDKSIKDFE